jgi:hypothetical protein
MMSEAKIIKEYKKLYFDFKGKDILKGTYLLSDSKGLCLKEVLPNQYKKKFHTRLKRRPYDLHNSL